MEKLIQGIHRFKSDVFAQNLDFYRKLADGQRPLALFITCSDSRMVPDLICQTQPGELFVLRNAGQYRPALHARRPSGEAATIEYAIRGLGIRDIILCGHTRCGAMQAVTEPRMRPRTCRASGSGSNTPRPAPRSCPPATTHLRLRGALEGADAGERAGADREPAHAPLGRRGDGRRRTEAARVGLQDGDRRGVRLRPRVRAVQSAARTRMRNATSYPITRPPVTHGHRAGNLTPAWLCCPGSGAARSVRNCESRLKLGGGRWRKHTSGKPADSLPRRVVERPSRVARRLHGGAAAVYRHRPGERTAARGRHRHRHRRRFARRHDPRGSPLQVSGPAAGLIVLVLQFLDDARKAGFEGRVPSSCSGSPSSSPG